MYRRALALLVRRGRSRRRFGGASRAPITPGQSRDAAAEGDALEFADRRGCWGFVQEIENRWPEWSTAWMAHGMILAARGNTMAEGSIETAVRLGARSPRRIFSGRVRGERMQRRRRSGGVDARRTIRGCRRSPGRVALNGDDKLAVTRLQHRDPCVPAYRSARGAGEGLRCRGRKAEAAAELEKAKGAESDAPPYLGRLFQGSLR